MWRNRIAFALLLAFVGVAVAAASEWEGSALRGDEEQFAADGLYVLTSVAAPGSRVEIVNLETGEQQEAAVTGRPESPGVLLEAAPELARRLGLSEDDTTRIRVRDLGVPEETGRRFEIEEPTRMEGPYARPLSPEERIARLRERFEREVPVHPGRRPDEDELAREFRQVEPDPLTVEVDPALPAPPRIDRDILERIVRVEDLEEPPEPVSELPEPDRRAEEPMIADREVERPALDEPEPELVEPEIEAPEPEQPDAGRLAEQIRRAMEREPRAPRFVPPDPPHEPSDITPPPVAPDRPEIAELPRARRPEDTLVLVDDPDRVPEDVAGIARRPSPYALADIELPEVKGPRKAEVAERTVSPADRIADLEEPSPIAEVLERLLDRREPDQPDEVAEVDLPEEAEPAPEAPPARDAPPEPSPEEPPPEEPAEPVEPVEPVEPEEAVEPEEPEEPEEVDDDHRWAEANLPLIGEREPEAFYLQVGAYRDPRTAGVALDRLSAEYPIAVERAEMGDGTVLYRAYVGPIESDERGSALSMARSRGFRDAFVRSGGS